MKMTPHIVALSALTAPAFAAPIKSLGEGFNTPWTEIRIAFAVDPGCTGIETLEELIIARKGDQMTIHVKSTTSDRKAVYSSPRPLTKVEFDQIVQKTSEFYQQAEKEVDLNEYFESLPEKEREAKLEEYFKKHGRPIGGFGGKYILVQFQANQLDSIVMNAFVEAKSYQAFIEWIRAASDSAKR